MLKIKIHELLKCDNSSNIIIIFIKTKKMQPIDTKKNIRKDTNESQLDKKHNKLTAKVNSYRKEAVFLLQRKSKIEV